MCLVLYCIIVFGVLRIVNAERSHRNYSTCVIPFIVELDSKDIPQTVIRALDEQYNRLK